MSFDRIAPHYRWLETLAFGRQLQEARLTFVRQIAPPRQVLIAGEGNGRFLGQFVRVHPAATIDCIESSARMISLARQRTGAAPVNFIQADLRDLPLAANHYDLIVTHFFLDCLCGPVLHEVVQKLASSATTRAEWLLADFRLPRSGWRHLHAQVWLDAMYRFFRLTTGLETGRLEDPSQLLKATGFACLEQRRWRFGLIKSEHWRRSA